MVGANKSKLMWKNDDYNCVRVLFHRNSLSKREAVQKLRFNQLGLLFQLRRILHARGIARV